MTVPSATEFFLPRAGLQGLIDALRADGYRVIGPTVDQAAVILDEIASVDALPRGWADAQAPGEYRLVPGEDRYFGYTIGPQSWKRFLFPPDAVVAKADQDDGRWRFETVADDAPPLAFLGVRACELAAIAVQDRTFLHGPYVDPIYKRRRERALLIAANCTGAAATCFCTSTETGPRCRGGYDLALTELPDGFTIEVGSDRGGELLRGLSPRDAAAEERDAAEAERQRAVEQISKRLDTTDVRGLLLSNLEHPRWAETATRCLSCTNCTMVCPTCFCSSVSDVSDVRGEHVERRREWDSCFNSDFSYMNGGVVRGDVRSRYRQWLTHKLASWHDQFGTSGCVGCGRCVTWCPVGIDLTEEVAAIRGEPS
ncbi:4Fe-4S dicluster domain-containing protein [Alienimonas sp. DA493]|uniref:4Fe-4S dicluster domain-containing protein n=1 Tax=Alienimonas sp. DA493 TaxID=3373605 RepID=UPI003753FFF4